MKQVAQQQSCIKQADPQTKNPSMEFILSIEGPGDKNERMHLWMTQVE
jgi:hypothetical protein